MQPLQLSYKPDYEQLFHASAAIAARRYTRGQRFQANAIIFGSLIGGGILSAVGGIALHMTLLPQVPLFVPILIFMALVFLAYSKLLVPWLYRRSARYVTQARGRTVMQFTADETGLRWQDKEIDFLLRWQGVEGIFATKGSLCFLSGLVGLVLPLDVFADASARKAFVVDALSRLTPEAAEKTRADPSMKALLA